MEQNNYSYRFDYTTEEEVSKYIGNRTICKRQMSNLPIRKRVKPISTTTDQLVSFQH